MTQYQLAHGIGVTPGSMSSMLNNKKTIGPKVAKKIAAFLGQPDNWRRFVEMPGEELRRVLLSKKRISGGQPGVNRGRPRARR